MTKCFLCNKPLRTNKPYVADTMGDQIVYVGSDCYKKVIQAGLSGLPTSESEGWVKLYTLTQERLSYLQAKGIGTNVRLIVGHFKDLRRV